MLQIDFFEYLV